MRPIAAFVVLGLVGCGTQGAPVAATQPVSLADREELIRSNRQLTPAQKDLEIAKLRATAR